jgi:hypothetical protein
MLLTLMFFCAVVAVILIAFSTFDGLRDLWPHPDHRPDKDNPYVAKPRR